MKPSKETATAPKASPVAPTRMSGEKFNAQLNEVGDIFRRNSVSKAGGDDTEMKKTDKAFQALSDSVKDQAEMMKNASDDQKSVFKEMIEETTKLRKNEKFDRAKAHQEFKAAMARIHQVDGPENVKEFLDKVAATGMQHTEAPQKSKGIKGAMESGLESFFKPTKDDLESPLFRHLSGMDKNKDVSKLISSADMARNEGIAERLKDGLGEDIESDKKDKSTLQKLTEQMMGKGGGAFPDKIENLHVTNLIIKNTQDERTKDKDASNDPNYRAKGISAVAVPQIAHDAPIDNVHGADKPKNPDGSLIVARTKRLDGPPELNTIHPDGQKRIGHVAVKQIGHDDHKQLEYTEFKESPVAKKEDNPSPIVQRNPHAKLNTQKTVMAQAIASAMGGAALPIAKPNTIVDSFKPKPDLLDNDLDPKYATEFKEDEEPAAAPAAGGSSGLVPDINVVGRGRKGGIRSKTGIMRKIGGIAKGGIIGAVAGLGLNYAGQKLADSGHDQLSAGADVASTAAGWAGTGAMMGSVVPGLGTAAGAVVGGVAGAAYGAYKNWDKVKPSSWGTQNNNNSGENLAALNAAKSASQAAPAASVPIIMNSSTSNSSTKFVPVQPAPRNRESYFDRQMMGSFTK